MKKNNLDRSGKSIGRPTLVLQEQRDAEIIDMLLGLKSRKEIYVFCKEKYNIKPKSVDGLIDRAYKHIGQNYGVDKQGVINVHLQKYYQIVRDAENIDFRSQIAALNSIEKILRLTNPETLVQQNSINLSLKDMTLSDLKQLLEVKDKEVEKGETE